jgi:hypothetical protein
MLIVITISKGRIQMKKRRKRYRRRVIERTLAILTIFFGTIIIISICFTTVYAAVNNSEVEEKQEQTNLQETEQVSKPHKVIPLLMDCIDEEQEQMMEELSLEAIPESELEQINEQDVHDLALIIDLESDGSEQDRLAVGNVVLNRVECKNFPNTIQEVIRDNDTYVQYECVYNGKFDSGIEPSEEAIQIAKRLLDGERIFPHNVVWQAQFMQGDGLYTQIGVHYYCYTNMENC